VRQEGGNQVVVLDDLGEVGAFGIAIEVQRAGPVNSELLRLWLRAVPGGPAAAAAGWTAGASPQPCALELALSLALHKPEHPKGLAALEL
jgi:hypothetical protein